VVLRSPALAVAMGVVYVLPVEAIIVRLWDSGDRRRPRALVQPPQRFATAPAGVRDQSWEDGSVP
jgi:hypothetical protein